MIECDMRPSPYSIRFVLAEIFALVFLLSVTDAAERARDWVSNDGKKLRAVFVAADDASVTLLLENRSEVTVPLSRLSDEDRAFVEERRKTARLDAIGEMGEMTELDGDVEVTGGPRVFLTPHFQFETDGDVSKAFISEASRIYEGTLLAMQNLPHGLEIKPPEGETHFRGLFMTDTSFSARARTLNSGTPASPFTRVAGLYVPAEKQLLVPYSSLGAKRLGSRMTLRKSSDTTTLVHEITHQLMHDWLPFVPVWFAEGMAEYVAAIPYQNGRFDFSRAERGLKERLEERYQISRGNVGLVTKPSTYLRIPKSKPKMLAPGVPAVQVPRPIGSGWNGSLVEYRDAMLFIYYLIHLDDAQNPGATLGAYLRAVDDARSATGKIQEDIAAYEVSRAKYNEEVTRFNKDLTEFKDIVDEYNRRVGVYNDQLKRGIPEDERIKVGEIPEEPTPPDSLEIPESLASFSNESGPIDLPAFVKERTIPVLIGDRATSQIDEAMIRAYAEIGIEIGN